jgi:NADP-dependent 3-hydroxy acid dehydrogenase YdfG
MAISEGLRRELTSESRIRVTVISPGLTESELRAGITDEEILAAQKSARKFTPLTAYDIAQAAVYAIAQPRNVDVNEILLRPVEQPS